MQGKLIYIEGGEATGKSTQCGRLAEIFTREGHKVHRAHEPGGGLGKLVRDLLFLPELEQLPKKRRRLVEYHLFLADRAAHAAKLEERISEGCIILSDRGRWGTVVYQGYAQGMDINKIMQANEEAMEGVTEDLVIVLDGDPEELNKRLITRGETNRFDDKPLDFHRSVRRGFTILARKHNWPVIDAVGSEEEITAKLRAVIRDRLGI